jgi:hypothetical protein
MALRTNGLHGVPIAAAAVIHAETLTPSAAAASTTSA